MNDERELLRRTAELAADFLDTLDERPVVPLMPPEELGAHLAVPLPDAPTDPLEVIEMLASELDSGLVATAGATVLRIRHRRSAARSTGRGLADLGMGSEHRPLRRRACGLLRREGGGRMGQGDPRPPRQRVGRIRHRLSDGTRHLPCRSTSRRPRSSRLGRRARRTCASPGVRVSPEHEGM